MNIVQNSQQKSTNSKQPFFLMTAEQAKQDYKEKLITAETYIYYVIKAHRSAGWKWSFSVKEFCQEWEIKERTFYYAVSKLKSKKLIEWQTEGRITVWWGSDIAINDSSDSSNSPNLNPVSSPQTFAEATQDIAVEMQTFAPKLPTVAVQEQTLALKLQTFAEQQPETFVEQPLQAPIDIKQIEAISTDIASNTENAESSQNDASVEASSAELVGEGNVNLSDEELREHLEAAQRGIKPTQEIESQLRYSAYSPNYQHVAKQNGWEIKPRESSITPEAKQEIEALITKQRNKRWGMR